MDLSRSVGIYPGRPRYCPGDLSLSAGCSRRNTGLTGPEPQRRGTAGPSDERCRRCRALIGCSAAALPAGFTCCFCGVGESATKQQGSQCGEQRVLLHCFPVAFQGRECQRHMAHAFLLSIAISPESRLSDRSRLPNRPKAMQWAASSSR